MTDGVGQLLFEMCRGVSNQLHSCTDSVLPLLLSKLGPEETVFEALSKMMQLMGEHTRKEFAGPLWKPLLVSSPTLSSFFPDLPFLPTLMRATIITVLA